MTPSIWTTSTAHHSSTKFKKNNLYSLNILLNVCFTQIIELNIYTIIQYFSLCFLLAYVTLFGVIFFSGSVSITIFDLLLE